jgi:hypothetical protein
VIFREWPEILMMGGWRQVRKLLGAAKIVFSAYDMCPRHAFVFSSFLMGRRRTYLLFLQLRRRHKRSDY